MYRTDLKVLISITSLLALLSLTPRAEAAISIGPAGAGPLTFDTAPVAADFGTLYYRGDGNSFNTIGQIDSAITSLTATVLTGAPAPPSSATIPPVTYAYGFVYNSAG